MTPIKTETKPNSIPPAKGSASAKWTPLDRRLLFDYVEQYGSGSWTAAAASVPGKNAKQVSQRCAARCEELMQEVHSVETSGCESHRHRVYLRRRLKDVGDT